MFEFHKDRSKTFQQQYLTTKNYIIPFIQEKVDFSNGINVLEIGCGEAGVLKAFLELGHRCTGIELSESRVELAKQYHKEAYESGNIQFIARNIYDINVDKDLNEKFDLIILKDVIEHIPNQDVFMRKLKDFLKPDGKVFFGFPPWQMPFGGHQQVCSSKFLSLLPWYHLLPWFLYRGLLKLFGERESTIESLKEIKDTGISIERFERIVKTEKYKLLRKQFFLINPIYSYKFNMKVRKQFGFISVIPWVRNFWTTAVYYLLEK